MSLSADGIQGELVLAVQVCLQVIIFAAAKHFYLSHFLASRTLKDRPVLPVLQKTQLPQHLLTLSFPADFRLL